MAHYPPSQAYMGTSAWAIFISQLGVAILNDRTYESNKNKPYTSEKGESLIKAEFADFDPKAGILGLSDYVVTHATLLHEKTPTDSPLQAIPHEYWNMGTFKKNIESGPEPSRGTSFRKRDAESPRRQLLCLYKSGYETEPLERKSNKGDRRQTQVIHNHQPRRRP